MTSTHFAAAQARIAARRAQNHNDHNHSASSLSRTNSLPSGLSTIAAPISSFWSALYSSTGTRPAFRVGQVDAELLDEELLSLFRTQVSDAFKYISTHAVDDWSSEVTLLLRAALWKLTMWDRGASYGASLQGLKYVDARAEARVRSGSGLSNDQCIDPSRWQKAGHGLLTIVGSYAWQKWEDWLVERQDRHSSRPGTFMQMAEIANRYLGTTHEIASLLSFLAFLYNGRYRTLTDRLLRLRLTPSQAHTGRQVSFEYLNRQLVWHAFTEFLLFVLPLVGVARWKRILSRAWKQVLRAFRRSSNADDEDLPGHGELSFLPERTCAICYKDQNALAGSTAAGQGEVTATSGGGDGGVVGSAQTDITNPYEAMPCGCVYCFVCLAHAIEATEGYGWTCLRCGENVKECKPWNGDVVEDVHDLDREDQKVEIDMKRMSRKSVVFVEEDEDDTTRNNSESTKRLSAVDPIPLDDEDNEDTKQFYRGHGSDTSETDEISDIDVDDDDDDDDDDETSDADISDDEHDDEIHDNDDDDDDDDDD